MKIYVTSLKFIDNDDFKQVKLGEAIEVHDSCTEYFSSQEKSLEFLKNELKNNHSFGEEYSVLNASISEIELDKPGSESVTHIYDKDLQYLGVFDFETITTKSQYKKGDWVLFIQGSTYRCGLVDASPEGSEVGLIIYEDSNLNDCSPHDHTREFNIIQKISENRAKELLPRKYFEGIKRRFKEYNK